MTPLPVWKSVKIEPESRTEPLTKTEPESRTEPLTPIKPPTMPEKAAPKEMPKVDTRSWIDLSANEQEKWNERGGGVSNDSTEATRKKGITSIPWILRIGDPRIKEISEIRNGELFKRLKNQNRIGPPSPPEDETVEELKKELEELKGKTNEETYQYYKKLIEDLKNNPGSIEKVRTVLHGAKGQETNEKISDWFSEHTIRNRTELLISNFRRLARR